MDELETVERVHTIVRSAVAADIPQMVMIGQRFFDESGYTSRGIIADPNVLHASLESFIGSNAHGVFVAASGDKVSGVACPASYAPYCSTSLLAKPCRHNGATQAAIGLRGSCQKALPAVVMLCGMEA